MQSVAPRKTIHPFPARQNSESPDLNASLMAITQSHCLSQCHYSSPSSLLATLLVAPLVLLAELLVSLILGCGVLFVVGAAEVSFCEDESSSSFSSGCSCSCF